MSAYVVVSVDVHDPVNRPRLVIVEGFAAQGR